MTDTRGERLRRARERHFKSARAAANDLGSPPATYGAHERAQAPCGRGRDYGPEEAALYAARFKVRPEWLLTGAGQETEPVGHVSVPSDALAKVVSALERNTDALIGLLFVIESLERILAQPAQKQKDESALPENASMPEILASIRRIIAEDRKSNQQAETPGEPNDIKDKNTSPQEPPKARVSR
jgi:hypothetical protein